MYYLTLFLWLSVSCYTVADTDNDDTDSVFYPVTASWFKDRYTAKEWDDTLKKFSSIGGDTVVLRAPPVVIRSPDDIRKDPNFQWCKSSTGTDCITDAQQDLGRHGLNIKAYATYQYEENFSERVIRCPQYEVRINNTRVYYRLVLPISADTVLSPDSCDLPAGTDVLLLFTSFAGTDPHEVLVSSAKKRKMKVYFGLPAAPMKDQHTQELDGSLIQAYYMFINRVIADHAYRYKFHGHSRRFQSKRYDTNVIHMFQSHKNVNDKSNNDTVVGYYATDETCLATIQDQVLSSQYTILEMYKNLGKIVHNFQKKFMLSPYIDLNKSQENFTLSQHVNGFGILAKTGVVDIIAVQEGRGSAKGCYYNNEEIDKPISEVDPGLLKIVQYLGPKVRPDVTYRQQFIGSNNQLFKMFSDTRDQLSKSGLHFEFWLNVDAFEYLRDDPCLPVDHKGSGMDEMLDRTSKYRLDWALSVAGVYVNKVISFAWDPDYTCTTKQYNTSLADEIFQDAGRPIIMSCGWHNKYNMSMVIIGHGLLDQLTQAFEITYQTREGETKVATDMYAYYVEGDWGPANNRISSLIYTQLWDVGDPFDISMNGTVMITGENVYHPCIHSYDFR